MPLAYEDYASRVTPRSKLEWQVDGGGVHQHITAIGMDLRNLDALTAALELKHRYLEDIQDQYHGAQQRYRCTIYSEILDKDTLGP